MFENNETDPVLTLVPDYKVSISYSGTGTVLKFKRGYLTKEAFTLGPSDYRTREPVPGNQV